MAAKQEQDPAVGFPAIPHAAAVDQEVMATGCQAKGEETSEAVAGAGSGKKPRRRKFMQEATVEAEEETRLADEEADEAPVTEQPKRKQKRRAIVEEDQEAEEQTCLAEGQEEAPATDKPKRKQKRRAVAQEDQQAEEQTCLAEGQAEEAPVTEKPKRKQRRRAVAEEDQEVPIEGEVEEEPEAVQTKRKQKRKKLKVDEDMEAEAPNEVAGAEDVPAAVEAASHGEAGGGKNEEEPPPTEGKKKKRQKLVPEAGLAEPSGAHCQIGESAGDAGPAPETAEEGGAAKKKKNKNRGQQEEQNQEVESADAGSRKEAAVGASEAKPEADRKNVEEQKGQDDDAAQSSPTSLKVCVGNLSTSLSKGAIWKRFERCGAISDVWVLRDWYTNASRGICFITFTDREGVRAALQLDGTTQDGQVLRINVAEDRKGKGSGKSGKQQPAQESKGTYNKGKGKGRGKASAVAAFSALGNAPETCQGILLRGLSYAVTEADLKEHFAGCSSGPSRIRLLTDKNTGESKGKAFLDFADVAGVEAAVKLNGTALKGRKIQVEYQRSPDAAIAK